MPSLRKEGLVYYDGRQNRPQSNPDLLLLASFYFSQPCRFHLHAKGVSDLAEFNQKVFLVILLEEGALNAGKAAGNFIPGIYRKPAWFAFREMSFVCNSFCHSYHVPFMFTRVTCSGCIISPISHLWLNRRHCPNRLRHS